MKDDISPSAAVRVYRELRQAILNRAHMPGEPLSRAKLAETYATSQTPVREALLRLEAEELVRVKPQAGTIVAPIRVIDIHQAQFLRRALEVDVVRRLALRPGQRDLTDVRRAMTKDVLPETFNSADGAFHRALFAAVGMEALLLRSEPLLTPLARCRALSPPDAARVAAALADHNAILARIEAADADGASQAMGAHLANALEGLGQLQRDHPEMFEDA